MGGVLSAPVELLHVERTGSSRFRAGVAEMQGWRSGHEDAHSMICADKGGSFWVLDGHGGEHAALMGAPMLGAEYSSDLLKGMPDDARIGRVLAETDQKLRDHFKEHSDKESGSTVTGALVTFNEGDGTYNLKMVNLGDSRGIVVRAPSEDKASPTAFQTTMPEHLAELKESQDANEKGFAKSASEWPVVHETIDHKPNHPTERSRILAAGGHVTDDDPARLDGNLAVSRGLGDFEYKQGADLALGDQKVSVVPDVYEVNNLRAGAICVLCCDGVWDVLSSEEVGAMAREALVENEATDLGDLAAKIVRTSFEKNSRDNVTAMVIQMGPIPEEAVEELRTRQPEIKHFGRLMAATGDGEALGDDVKGQYNAFLKKVGFPAEPCACDHCHRWLHTMQQCPCHTVFYCNKVCQKKVWKKHKTQCPLATGGGSAKSGGSGGGAGGAKKK